MTPTPIDNAYNIMDYSQWLEARFERAEQLLFMMRHHERGIGVMDEIAVRSYEAIEHFLSLVEDQIDHLRLRWELKDNGPGMNPYYCSFRVLIKAKGSAEIECGYDDPPMDIEMDYERLEAFNSLVENCELVDADVWNHLVNYHIFRAGEICNRASLMEARARDNLDEFIAARKAWLMERQTEPGASTARAEPRM